MTKGIRAYCNNKFLKTLPQLPELGNVAFRAKVMQAVAKKYEISVASAATHYNHAFKTVKAESPELVIGLGRAEDKKGGRPVIHGVTVIKTKTGVVVAEGVSKATADALIAAAEGKRGVAKLSIKEVAETVEAVTAVAA